MSFHAHTPVVKCIFQKAECHKSVMDKHTMTCTCTLFGTGQKPMFYQSIKHRKSMFYCFFATSPLHVYHKANEEAKAMYYTVENIFFGQLRTPEKCRKHLPAAHVFNISLCSQISVVFYHTAILGLGFHIILLINL